jgi:hypothetical protein
MRTSIAICLLLSGPTLASAQLRFSQPTADLGELRGGLVYQHRFDFANDSASPIEITDVRLGCGCLSPVLDKRKLQPGEKGSLLMHVRTLGQPEGARTWQAHVQYRAGNKEHETTLIVAAKIRNEITVEPSIVGMTIETTLKQDVTILDRRPIPLKVTNVLASSPAIKVNVQPLAGGARVTLEVSGAALTRARQEETLNIYTDDPHYRHLQVPITLTKAERANVTASPARVEISGAGSQLIRLRAAGDQAVRVDKIESANPSLKCTWAAGPGNDATLKIASPSGVDSQTNVRVHVGSNIVTIPVTLRKD